MQTQNFSTTSDQHTKLSPSNMEDMPADVAEQLGARMGETYSEDACVAAIDGVQHTNLPPSNMEDMPADVAEQLGARMGETYSEDACNGEQIPEHLGLTLHCLCTIRDAGADNFMVGCNVARLGMYDEVWRFGAARLSSYR